MLAGFVDRNPNVRELAVALNMSPRHLTNRCRKPFGQSPARLLLQSKMRRADELLEYRGMRVSEVNDAPGFVNPFHFPRVHRRCHGHAPSIRIQVPGSGAARR